MAHDHSRQLSSTGLKHETCGTEAAASAASRGRSVCPACIRKRKQHLKDNGNENTASSSKNKNNDNNDDNHNHTSSSCRHQRHDRH